MSGGVPKYPWWLIEPISWVRGAIEIGGKPVKPWQWRARLDAEYGKKPYNGEKFRVRVRVPGVNSTDSEAA
jgi:hypothetical protein